MNSLLSQNKEKLQTIISAQDKIYAVAQSLKVEDTETKVNSFNAAKATLSQMERNTESIKDSVSIIKDKIRDIERAQRDAARERRRNSRS